MYGWALPWWPFPQTGNHQRMREDKWQQRKYCQKTEPASIVKRIIFLIFFGGVSMNCFTKLSYCSLTLSFALHLSIYISLRQRSHKRTDEHQFLSRTSKIDTGPHRGGRLLCCTLQPGISKAFFFFTFTAVMKWERVQKRTQWLPILSPPSFLVMIVCKYYSEFRIASPNWDSYCWSQLKNHSH